MTKIWYPVKIQFLSFPCEDMAVVMATSVSANRKTASQHLAIGVLVYNKQNITCLFKDTNFSSHVQLHISRVSTANK